MEPVEEVEIEEAGAGAGEGRRFNHPSYNEMVTDALVTLRQRNGSSSRAIQAFIEQKHHGDLPPNFNKLLRVQLLKLVNTGRLVKVKNSYKLSPAAKRRRAREVACTNGKMAMANSLIDQLSSLYAHIATTHKRTAKRKGRMDLLQGLILLLSTLEK